MFFEYPKLLWLMAIPVLMVLHYVYLELFRRPHMRVSVLYPWAKTGCGIMGIVRHIPFALRIFALVMIVLAIARPRSVRIGIFCRFGLEELKRPVAVSA